jgi:peptide/nickel transport system substrate-binding protein
VAINRDEINNLVYLGLGHPRQATVIDQSLYYKPEFGSAYAQYDTDMANQLLDEMGLTTRDSDGFRVRSDGQTLSLTIDVPGDIFGPWQDVSGLVAEYWNAIGIKTVLNVIDRSLMVSRSRTDEFEVGVWGMDSALDFLLRARYWIPQSSVTFAPLQYKWMSSDGESGVEPNDAMKRVIELYSLALATPDEAERVRLAHEMLELHAENVWVIGTVGMAPALGVVKNNFRNVPESAVTDYTVHNPGNTHPSQYFIRQ